MLILVWTGPLLLVLAGLCPPATLAPRRLADAGAVAALLGCAPALLVGAARVPDGFGLPFRGGRVKQGREVL